MSFKVAFFDAKKYDIESFLFAKEKEENKKYAFEFKFFNERLSFDNVILTKGYDAVCIFVNDNITKEVIEELYQNKVKLIALRCAGYNNVDFQEAFEKIHIVRVPEYSPYAVAEYTVSLMLALNRKIHKAYGRTRDANFALSGLMGFDMNEKTVGIIGTGKIAKVVMKILKGYGMNIMAYDIFPDKEFEAELGFKYVDINTLYAESDIISLHCPLNNNTEYIINAESISKMKDGVMIINTGRGKLINTKELIEGLKSQKIGSAGLDVYEEESNYFFEDKSDMIMTDDLLSRLLTFGNVIVTSHQAFFTKEALNNIADITLSNMREFIDDIRLKNEICYRCDKFNGICKGENDIKCF